MVVQYRLSSFLHEHRLLFYAIPHLFNEYSTHTEFVTQS
jgi:hypothetical protein